MHISEVIVILSLAFGLGMLHALDADHMLAVTGMVANEDARRKSVRFCLRWAIGHGLVLLCIGTLVFLFGLSIPASLSHYAEMVVGIILIGIGALVLINILRNKAHLHFHAHDDLPAHAHWHTHNEQERANHKRTRHRHEHGPVLVGMLHGLAGSAPLLAIIPLSMLDSPLTGVLYLLLFSLGVLLAMLLFGGVLGMTMQFLQRVGQRFFLAVRALTGLAAMFLGAYIIQGLA